MAGVRFEDVDLLGALSRIVDLHTQHYKEDFDLDKELISKLAVSDRSEDKQLLWMSRPCGTYTLREREVYLDGSHENKVWRFYQEQTNDPVLAYAISLKEVRDGKIFGNLYPLNYREHGAIFTEILKGSDSRRVFFEKILDVLTMMGGGVNDVR